MLERWKQPNQVEEKKKKKGKKVKKKKKLLNSFKDRALEGH